MLDSSQYNDKNNSDNENENVNDNELAMIKLKENQFPIYFIKYSNVIEITNDTYTNNEIGNSDVDSENDNVQLQLQVPMSRKIVLYSALIMNAAAYSTYRGNCM